MKSKARDRILFYLNGERVEIRGANAGVMLSDFLRYERGLTGTKVVCAEGDCGACSVLRKFCGTDPIPKYYEPINSCITTVAQMDCSSLVTVEYLGEKGLDPVQAAMVQCHGSQCGYCTPGFVMALKGLVEKKKTHSPKQKKLLEKETKNALTGNLCRCTGYLPIIDAALAIPLQSMKCLSALPWASKAEMELRKEAKCPIHITEKGYTMFSPTSVKEAARYLSKHKSARIIGAGTDLGVMVNKGKMHLPNLLTLNLISELYEIQKVGTKKEGYRLRVGARVTLEKLRVETETLFPRFSSYLDIFASPQIKNVATLVGNIANASPIGDTLPFLLAMDAKLLLVGPKAQRWLELDRFYLGYRKTALKRGEIISGVEFDLPALDEDLFLLKTSQRKDLDISAVNGAIRLSPKYTRVALGGIAAVPKRIEKLERYLKTQLGNVDCIPEAVGILQKEIAPLSDLRGSQALRRFLAETFLKSALLEYYSKVGAC